MEEKQQYPEWQQAIREAQAEHTAQVAEEHRKWAEQENARKMKEIEAAREKLAEYGLVLPDNGTTFWAMDDYYFEVGYDASYRRVLYIRKDVPGAEEIDRDSPLWYSKYRVTVVEEVQFRYMSGAAIADALDALDKSIQVQIETNAREVARIQVGLEIKARQEERTKTLSDNPSVATDNTPSLESRLLTLIREIVREEMGVIRDSQFESLL